MTSSTQPHGPFLPLLLFGLSLVLFFGWQIQSTRERSETLRNAIEKRAEARERADQLLKKFEQIATDVIRLAPEDQGAQAVVAKYGISLRDGAAQADATAEATH